MARPKKDAPIDLAEPQDLTKPLIERLTCPAGQGQAFMRDKAGNGLRVRVTAAGAKSYVFESKLDRETIRRTLGDVGALTIVEARGKARELQVMIDNKIDPREMERQRIAEKDRRRVLAKQTATTVQDAWTAYLAERRPFWSDLHYRDHEKMAQAGGTPRKRYKDKVTTAGPLAHFMGMRLGDVDAATVHTWAEAEAKARPARTRLALRLLKAFLRWCAAEDAYKTMTDVTAASGKKTRELAGTPKQKNDYIQREQLSAWFTRVQQLSNPVISAYLQCLLLTGARREELAELKWDDVNFQWRGMTLKDKVEGQRAVPLTPYVAQLLEGLPKRNEWVFSSVTAIKVDDKNKARRGRYHAAQGGNAPIGAIANRSESGRLVEPSIAHRKACAAAGLDGLTLHGLRRSFASLCEWLDIPGGISAQIQGHAPQGVREQNYIRRPLDLLRVHHEKIEAWILEQAGIEFDPKAPAVGLRAVS